MTNIIPFPHLPRVVRIAKGMELHDQINKQVDEACYTDIPALAEKVSVQEQIEKFDWRRE